MINKIIKGFAIAILLLCCVPAGKVIGEGVAMLVNYFCEQ